MNLTQEIINIQNVLMVGQKALAELQKFAATGEWLPFLDYVTEDVSITFSGQDSLGGVKVGKAELEKLLRTFSEDLGLRVTHTAKPPMINITSFAAEFIAKGTLGGQAVQRSLIVVFDIQGDKIAAIREYALS
jgi:hypothetical protein